MQTTDQVQANDPVQTGDQEKVSASVAQDEPLEDMSPAAPPEEQAPSIPVETPVSNSLRSTKPVSAATNQTGDVRETGPDFYRSREDEHAFESVSEAEEEDTFYDDRGNDGKLWRRLSNLGITLVILAALVYVIRDVIPPSWSDRMTEITGLPRVVELLLGPGTDAVAASAISKMQFETGAVKPEVAELAVPPENQEAFDTRAKIPGREEGAASNSVEGFLVNFSADSELLESDAWHALDSAAVIMRAEPDRFAVFTDLASGPVGERPDPELSQTRISAIKQYLVAAGIDRQRLSIEVPSGNLEKYISGEGQGRLVHISIGSRAAE